MHLKIRIGSFGKTYIKIVQYCLIMLFFISHNTWYYSLYDMAFRLCNLLVVSFFILLVPRTRDKNIIKILMFCLIPTILMELIFAGPVNMGDAINNYLFMVETILLTHVTYQYDKENFCNRFIKTTVFFAVISLAFYIVSQIDYMSLIDSGILYKVDMNRLTYTNYYCNIFYALRDREIYRNVGMFCEPGLYQIILNSAIYIIVFYQQESKIKYRKTTLFILICTVITNQSGTGYIGLLIILIGILLSNRKNIDKKVKYITLIIVLISISVFTYDGIKNGNNSFLYHVVFEKLLNIGSSELTTGSVRLDTIKTMLHLILFNPMGYGFTYVSNYKMTYAAESVGARIFVTCAAIGVIPILILLYYYLKKAYRNKSSNVQFWVLILIYINTALAQSREFYPAILVLFLLNKKENKSTKDNISKGLYNNRGDVK